MTDSCAPRLAAEFFAGIGLVRLALERCGWRVVFANDLDPKKRQMYAANFSTEDWSSQDIHLLSAKDVPTCELFTASFPCTDLSIAGAGRGLAGKGSGAFWGFVRVLSELGERRPRFVLLENVIGFLQSRQGRDLESALAALGELGYCVDAMVLNANRFTPQSRPRLFVIGEQSDENQVEGWRLSKGFEASELRPAMLAEFIMRHPQLPWRIRDLPPPPVRTTTLAEILEDLPDDDPHWWSRPRAEYFFGQLSVRHREIAERMIAGPSRSYATAFRRIRLGRSMAELRTDGLAGCLRTPRGGSGRQILFEGGLGRYRVRLITAREAARLQGAPDDYVIDVPLNQALFGFGDAVCVPAVEWIVAQCFHALNAPDRADAIQAASR